MTTPAIRGRILALLREYKLREVPDGLSRQFFTKSRMPPLRGMGMTWWLTPKGVDLLADIARMTVAALPHLELDVDATAEVIEKVLKDHGDDSRAFSVFSFTRADSLFEARSQSEAELAVTVWHWIEAELRRSVTEWLVLVPLSRVKCSTTALGFDGLTLLDANDVEAWSVVAQDFDHAAKFDITRGVDAGGHRLWRSAPPQTWALCRVVGTADVAQEVARERFQTLIALLFAHELPACPVLALRSAGAPDTLATQFASKSADMEFTRTTSSIGVLKPPAVADLVVAADMLDRLGAWYSDRDAAVLEIRQRAVAGSHFVQYGYVAAGLERFIHFFVALDAFFGVRGKVERSIIAAVQRLFPNEAGWEERAARLFDLRSELLHGGSSRIKSWSGYEDYRRHFRADPERDVMTLATSGLREFFKVKQSEVGSGLRTSF